MNWSNLCIIGVWVFTGACGGANVRNLPIASAVIVHSCAAAEADTYVRGAAGGDYAVSEMTISLKASGENKLSISETVGVDAVRGAEKTAELKLTRLPTMAQCKAWGYLPQLGNKGCLVGTHGCVATTELPLDVAPPPKAKGDKHE